MVIPIYSRLLYYTLFSGVHHLGSNIPYFSYFFKTINSSIYNWFGYGATTAGMIFGETSFYFPIFLGLVSILISGWGITASSAYFYRLSIKVQTQSAVFSVSPFL